MLSEQEDEQISEMLHSNRETKEAEHRNAGNRPFQILVIPLPELLREHDEQTSTKLLALYATELEVL